MIYYMTAKMYYFDDDCDVASGLRPVLVMLDETEEERKIEKKKYNINLVKRNGFIERTSLSPGVRCTCTT